MERLTGRNAKGEVVCRTEATSQKDTEAYMIAALERLAAYEDTGLEPEQVWQRDLFCKKLGKMLADVIRYSGADLSRPEKTSSSKKPKKAERRSEPKTARSRNGWVKLSDSEYHRLVEELGEAEARRCIDYVDEQAQKTNNRNGWKDWNLVVRSCHRDGWGGSHGVGGGKVVSPRPGDDYNPSAERIRKNDEGLDKFLASQGITV